MKISTEAHFDAAHRLPDHPGKCRRLHGHTYTIRAEIRGPLDESTGMVVDFGHVSAALQAVTAQIDHTYLNEVQVSFKPELFPSDNPTAERLAQWIHALVVFRMEEQGFHGLVSICLREGCKAEAVYP